MITSSLSSPSSATTTTSKVFPHVNFFMWLLFFLIFNGTRGDFGYELNDQLDYESVIGHEELLPVQISSPNIGSYDPTIQQNSIESNNNNYFNEANKKISKGKKLFSSAVELLQTMPPPLSLANYLGSAFPGVSYPVLGDMGYSHQMPSISSQQLNLVNRKKRSPGSRSKSTGYLTSLPLENVCESESRWVFKVILLAPYTLYIHFRYLKLHFDPKL